MSERGVRGVRTVGGYRTPRRSDDIDDIPDIKDPVDIEDTTQTAVATETKDDPYVVVAGEPDGDRGKADRRGPRTITMPRRLVVLLAVLTALITTFAILFGIWWNGMRVQADNRAAAQHTASNFLIALTNFDSKTINADFNRIASYATGNFAKQATQFFGPQIRQQLQVAQAQSRGEISSIYVQSASSNNASVYSVVDQTIVNKNFNAPQADELRVVLTMNKTGGGWRVGDVTVLQAPLTGGASAGTSGGQASPPAQPSP
jgi:hypothetical protein